MSNHSVLYIHEHDVYLELQPDHRVEDPTEIELSPAEQALVDAGTPAEPAIVAAGLAVRLGEVDVYTVYEQLQDPTEVVVRLVPDPLIPPPPKLNPFIVGNGLF